MDQERKIEESEDEFIESICMQMSRIMHWNFKGLKVRYEDMTC